MYVNRAPGNTLNMDAHGADRLMGSACAASSRLVDSTNHEFKTDPPLRNNRIG